MGYDDELADGDGGGSHGAEECCSGTLTTALLAEVLVLIVRVVLGTVVCCWPMEVVIT